MKALLPVFLVALFTCSCKNAKDPIFEKVEHFKLGKLGLIDTDLAADLRFTNLNGFGLRLKSIECDLYVDSSYLGHFVNADAIHIPARRSFVLPMNGQVKSLVLMEQTRKAFAGKQSVIQVTGKARVGRAGFYKTIPVMYLDTLLLSDLNIKL
jgi:LEA14-like dessication related protein